MYRGSYMLFDHGFFPFGGIIFIVLGVLMLLAITYIIVNEVRKGRGMRHTRTPLDIINERYDKGELSLEEYVKLVKELS